VGHLLCLVLFDGFNTAGQISQMLYHGWEEAVVTFDHMNVAAKQFEPQRLSSFSVCDFLVFQITSV